MTKIYIIHHLGLGDQLTLNGMVRHFVEHGWTVRIMARQSHQITSEFMYRDLPEGKVSLEIIDSKEPVPSSQEIWKRAHVICELEGYTLLPLATYQISDDAWNWFTIGEGRNMCNWLQATYIQAGLNPFYMKTKFKVVRDADKENEIFDHFGLIQNEYIFVHDAKSRGISIELDNLKIFNPDDHYKEFPNIFDYCKIIECAKEVHCFGSSYAMLIELMGLNTKDKNFYHTFENASGSLSKREVLVTYSDDIWTFV